jgi:histidinol-phosphate phosphatase family protein
MKRENKLIRYLLIDFDGTIRETILDPTIKNPNDRRPPFNKEEVKLIDGVKEKLKEWDNRGWQIIGVSNQSGVEKGIVTEEEVEKVAAHTMDLLGIYFPFYFAPFKRCGTKEQLNLRKPNIGMAEQAIEDWGEMDKEQSLMVGDYITDREFADKLGIRYLDINYFLKGKNNEQK